MTIDNDRSILKTIDRALQLLLAFSEQKSEWGVTELSNHFQWEKSVVQRMLSTLQERDFVSQNPETKKYRLSFAVLTLGKLVSSRLDMKDVALAFMQRLAQQTGESVILTVPHNRESVCIEVVEGPSKIRYSDTTGSRTPMHVGAGSKVLFSDKTNEELTAMLQDYEFTKFTPQTPDRDTFFRDMEEIRRRGIAVSVEEIDTGVAAVAVPIWRRREVVAALCLIGPMERMISELPVNERLLIEAGRELSDRLNRSAL